MTDQALTKLHNLSDKWTLWAHLPHDTDWSAASYIKIHKLASVEEAICLKKALNENVVLNCMLFLMLDDVLPSDELETLAVMLAAPFCVIEETTLVRLTQGKRLAPKPGETAVTYSPPLKRIYVPAGIRARVIHAQ